MKSSSTLHLSWGEKKSHSALAKVRNRIISVSLTEVLNRSCIKSSSMLYLSWGLQVGMYHVSATKRRKKKSPFSLTKVKTASTKASLCSSCLGEQVATWVSPHQVGNTTIFLCQKRRIKSSQVKSTSSVFHKWKISMPNESEVKS